MRVATYTQPASQVQGSLIAIALLVLTILLGTRAVHSTMVHFVPALSTLETLIWVFAYLAAGAGLMFAHGINWISWIARYRILLLILLLGCIISVTWSMLPLVSAERAVHLFGCSILAIYIGFMVPLLAILRVSAVVLGALMLISVASALAMPELGIENYEGTQVWKGVFGSKNGLGFWAAISVLLFLTLFASTHSAFLKLCCLVLAAVSFVVLYQSHSATSLLALLMAGAICLYLYIAIRFRLGFFRMVIMAVCFISLVAMLAANIDTAELVGRTDDLTGRGEVWEQTWKLIMKKPLTGYGYGALWFPTDDTLWVQQTLTDFSWVVFHAHNGMLQVASEIGLPLTCIALLMVAQQLIEIFYCQYEKQQVGVLFVLGFVIAYLVSNFSEARFLVNRELYWIFFLALPISMLRQINVVSADDGLAEAAEGVIQSVPGKPWLDVPGVGGVAPAMAAAGAIQRLPSPDIDLGGAGELGADSADLLDKTLDTSADQYGGLDDTAGDDSNQPDEYLEQTDDYDELGDASEDRYEKSFNDDRHDYEDDDDLDDTEER